MINIRTVLITAVGAVLVLFGAQSAWAKKKPKTKAGAQEAQGASSQPSEKKEGMPPDPGTDPAKNSVPQSKAPEDGGGW